MEKRSKISCQACRFPLRVLPPLLAGTLLLASAPAQAGLLDLLQGWLSAFNEKVAAYKTLSKQISASTEKLALANQQFFSASITALVADRQAQTTRHAVARFRDQGAFPCLQISISSITGDLFGSTDTAIVEASQKIASTDPGDETARYGTLMKLNRQAYCSQAAQQRGLCTASSTRLPAANSDFSQLLAEGTKSRSGYAAGYDYVDNIMPQRRPVFCRTPECEAKAADTRSLDAVDSMARLSLLAMIEGRSQQALPTAPTP